MLYKYVFCNLIKAVIIHVRLDYVRKTGLEAPSSRPDKPDEGNKHWANLVSLLVFYAVVLIGRSTGIARPSVRLCVRLCSASF